MGKKRKCRKMWEAIFAGSPDLVAGAKGTCNSRKAAKRILRRTHAENRRWYMEDVLGDLASIGLYNRDEDRSSGAGSELVQEQTQFTNELFDIQRELISTQTANDKISQAVVFSQIENEEKAKKQQQIILYLALAALAIIVVLKMKK